MEEAGYGEANAVHKVLDEEKGPTVVFADDSESIYLADMSGDGLTDIIRIRNGEVCYWPNLGYGRFGAKVAMASSPFFDLPDQFDPKRVRIGDIDGTGTSDIFYLTSHAVRFWYNQSGNSWSVPEDLTSIPQTDNLSSISVVDLLGHGTSCLVWSSPLPENSNRPMQYIDLMGSQKPHLLINIKNNLGAETKMTYAPSTKFYLEDKKAGKPWITRLAFPVHVVEKVETYDHISRNRFVTCYTYHHGYYDGVEREFRGFGRVDQKDTEAFAALSDSDTFPVGDNVDRSTHVPPVLTKTWFHTGAHAKGAHISRQLACEYYREGDSSLGHAGLSDAQLEAMLLDDTVLPDTIHHEDGSREPYQLTAEELREACRTLKGAILRQEIYALDSTEAKDRPYSVSERNYTIEMLQPENQNRHAIFFSHSRETIDFHYERKLYDINGQNQADPRVSHAMTLSVDPYGNVLQAVAIGYGRRFDDPDVSLTDEDKDKQKQPLITYTQNEYTDPIKEENVYRLPLQCDARTYELIKVVPDASQPNVTNLFRFEEIAQKAQDAGDGNHDLPYEDVNADIADEEHPYRRLIEHLRQLYYDDDLSAPSLLGTMASHGLPYETYKLALTPGLIASVYLRNDIPLLTDPNLIFRDEGGFILSDDYKACDWFPEEDLDGHWWLPSGQQFYSPIAEDTASPHPPDTLVQDKDYARDHFFLPQGVRDPFGALTCLIYDDYDLLLKTTQDPLNNIVTVEIRDNYGHYTVALDYRVLQPWALVDPNGNSTETLFDLLGLVAGTAVRGKNGEGDRPTDFTADLSLDQLVAFFTSPRGQIAKELLGDATTRIIYDITRYHRLSQNDQPTYAATITRETHASELEDGDDDFKIQVNFSYSDGFGREIQKKIQAEPEYPDGPLRWVGSGWTIFNNKGNPVRQFEPFFSTLEHQGHGFEFARTEGVSPILFYDPVERVTATLHPNHTWEKAVFDPWRKETGDVNDTVTLDPSSDADVSGFFFNAQGNARIPADLYTPTWYEQRIDGGQGPHEQAAAQKAEAHANTPTTACFDSLGRTFITLANTGSDIYKTRITFDIEGNQRIVWDRVRSDDNGYTHRQVMLYNYDMLGTVIHQLSMEAGARWMVGNAAGNPLRSWDSRQQNFRTRYDQLQRPTHHYLEQPSRDEQLLERIVYGEQHADAYRNLRGQPFRHYEQAGVVTNEAFDFKGNLTLASRTLANEYKTTIDWMAIEMEVATANDIDDLHNLAVAQLNETFTSRSAFDALNRPVQIVSPHNDDIRPNVIQHQYNAANLLERVDVWHQLEAVPGDLLVTGTADYPVVTNIDYNAKGQRELIQYGNGAETHYDYDRATFRLTRLYTRRDPAFTEDCGDAPHYFAAPEVPPPEQPCGLQNLHYTYDAMGNITRIQNHAQQRIFFNNQVVDSHNEYTYDALYRLTRATGREYLGLNNDGSINPPQQIYHRDNYRMRHPLPGDPRAVGRYREDYQYDLAGNIQSVHHLALTDANGNWWRYYDYDEESLIESGVKSNRLSATSRPGEGPESPYGDTYAYRDADEVDVHGCMTTMPHLTLMQWDYRDQLQATSTQEVVNPECQRETTYYVYDAAGQRVRKVNECYAAEGDEPRRSYERFYLNGFEIYRKYNGNGQDFTLQRDTLHVMDDQKRIALVEMRTRGEDGSPENLIR